MASPTAFLFVHAAGRACALPITHVVETLRPLPTEPVEGAPPFVRGLSVIRGHPIPVVDLAALLGTGETPANRYVALRAGDRRVALAVEAVDGVATLDAATLEDLPPLLRDAPPGLVEAIAARDSHLLLVLRAAHLIPEAFSGSRWSGLP